MHFKSLVTLIAVFVAASSALPAEELSAREPTEAYGCCAFGKRGEVVTKCCKRDVLERIAAVLPTELQAREPTEAYGCCAFGKRGELVTKCCKRDVVERVAAILDEA